ncbi:MAG: pentapeptide repeat-containing protein [Thermodesulfobacteriota bacterium]|nr:pentapeptide repeat-containing protein [Thermodesulfobacteriota bacterium]
MANQEHLDELRDVGAWNEWRVENLDIIPNLTGADLTKADLTGADLTEADLTEADLTGANLEGADLTGANLEGADLRGANLIGADLTEADLRGADLIGADLRRAGLTGADLRRAKLRGTMFDFGAWPLWCGGFNAKADDRLVSQLILSAIALDVSGCSDEIKEDVRTIRKMKIANKFSEYREDVKEIKNIIVDWII